MSVNSSTSKLSVFALVMLTVVSVGSIRNLPATALFGSSLISFVTLAAIFFLIPSALVSAELSSAFPEYGGVYMWVKRALGQPTGYLAIWYQWSSNVIFYPTILSYVAATMGYLISPQMATNPYFLIAVVLSSFWLLTILNLMGIKSSALFSNFCAIAGFILPLTFIVSLGILWFLSGQPMHIHFSWTTLFPHSEPHLWVALTGVMISFCGMEIATIHARDVKDPQRSFPKALIIATLILIATLFLGSLSIASVLPTNSISLVAGIMQAFDAFFGAYHLNWCMPIIALMLIIGGLGGVSNWIIAPTKGLHASGEDGNMPAHFLSLNKNGAPKTLLIYQAIIVSALMLVFLLMPSVNDSYWLLTVLATQLYMLMYMLMFVTGIRLRYVAPDTPRIFRIPGGKNFGMNLIASLGFIGAFVTFCVGFEPPQNISFINPWEYE
ncbi:MAG: amino acid permease, partial [Gammaproteobacteria bacterium]|nr:amino acid permease [Gammaproteobacteria bacterium]